MYDIGLNYVINSLKCDAALAGFYFMNEIIKTGKEIGYSDNHKYLWHPCVVCGKDTINRKYCSYACNNKSRIGLYRQRKPERIINGRVWILLPNHPKASKKGYVPRASIVLEEKLGRLLLPNEFAHHLDENQVNDVPTNLIVVTRQTHRKYHRHPMSEAQKIILRKWHRDNPISEEKRTYLSKIHKEICKKKRRDENGRFC